MTYVLHSECLVCTTIFKIEKDNSNTSQVPYFLCYRMSTSDMDYRGDSRTEYILQGGNSRPCHFILISIGYGSLLVPKDKITNYVHIITITASKALN